MLLKSNIASFVIEIDYYQCSDDMRSMEIMIDSPPSKVPSNFMSGSYTTPHARVTPFHAIPGELNLISSVITYVRHYLSKRIFKNITTNYELIVYTNRKIEMIVSKKKKHVLMYIYIYKLFTLPLQNQFLIKPISIMQDSKPLAYQVHLPA